LRSEPNWLPLERVLTINQEAVAATGETYFVRDLGLLESALAKPQHHWNYGEGDSVALAVQLIDGISRNHPFEQGNKRTAFITAVMFLKANGYQLTVPDGEKPLGHWVTLLVEGRFSAETFAEILKPFIEPIPV
jgi:death-on-curing protein